MSWESWRAYPLACAELTAIARPGVMLVIGQSFAKGRLGCLPL